MYPSALLHSFGVNGKVSGSVGAIGEMEHVLAVLHGPRGCGFHYRHSARRRHQPFYPLLCSDLTEAEVICGGADKLRRTVSEAWRRYRPGLILIIPTPVSDILNEDIRSVASQLRAQGVPVAAIQSELFSHRDKSYARRHVRALAKQKITGDNRLEMELKGCGFTEALYALVEQVMEPQEVIPRSVNIETVGWGSEGRLVLREAEDFLNTCGVTVHTWIPSAPAERLVTAPAAQLNVVKRVRWARRMKDRFGTDYLHLSGAGRYTGLDGIAAFYRDIGEKLHIAGEMEPLIRQAAEDTANRTAAARAELGQYRCVLICRGLQNAPFRIKLFAQAMGLSLQAVCLIVTPEMARSMDLTPELEEQLLSRIRAAAALYAPDAAILMNPAEDALRAAFSAADAVVGSNDFTLEGLGALLIPAMSETVSLSFPSYERNVFRLRDRLARRAEKHSLILNRMPFQSRHIPLYANAEGLAAKELWARMWLYREGAST